MREKHPQLEWHVLDIREMKENAELLGGVESYDAIIDKGGPSCKSEWLGTVRLTLFPTGTLDALMAETKGSVWDPSERVRQNIDREVDGVIQCVFRRRL